MAIARKASDIGVHARTIEQSLSSLSIADRLLGGKEVILRQAAEEVRPLMRAMAQANFSASGIESRTGPPSSRYTGFPSHFPFRYHSAQSTALMANIG